MLIHARIPNTNSEVLIEQLRNTRGVKIVEKNPTFELLHQPNDPLADSTLTNFSGQWILRFHDVYEAWDIEKGDSTITIGIVDTGLDSSNFDLLSNAQFNTNDPIDGINNDEDSIWGETLIDNYLGWDVADWDYNVTNKGESHGTKVAGVSSARTNNSTGVAGVGYKCKFMPIKTAPDLSPSSITAGYDGLLYAAEKGCQIINLSWGSTVLINEEILQDLIDLIVNDYNCIIIAAAGNSNLDERYYPASLDNVISVTGIKDNNIKQGRSTYNYAVDLCAVGRYVRTTYPNNEYKIESGTSMASPVVAGAAALLKSHFPTWTSKQITEQLRVTGEIIDTITNNLGFQYKLGKKINVYKALSDTLKPAIRKENLAIPNYPNFNQDGETITFSPTFFNYRHNASNVSISIEIIEGNATLVDSTIIINQINTLESYFNPDSTFSINLLPSINPNEYVVIKINYTSNGYDDYEIIELNFTPTVLTSVSRLNSFQQEKYLDVFPNPFFNNIEIDASIEFNTITIYNSLGEKIYIQESSKKSAYETINTSNLPQGIYLIEVSNESERLTQKMIK